MLRWARERSGLPAEGLERRFPKIEKWESGEIRPTLAQLEAFAKATHAPIGFLFLREPPVENIPLPDFRTHANQQVRRPSPDLLDTIYLCQQRQEWFHDYARAGQVQALDFIGSVTPDSDIIEAATAIRARLGFDLEERRQCPTWTEALRKFIELADKCGVLVMVTGVVGNNNYRKLNPDEFRGFAIVDDLAPLIFVNGSDTKAAQMFTLAHELAHIWLGQSALTDAQASTFAGNRIEDWCNKVAAELLVPRAVIEAEYQRSEDLRNALDRFARRFKVSTLVVLRRIYDVGGLTRDAFWAAYEAELAHLRAVPRSSGGDFYLTQGARVGKRFARALVTSTLEGQTLHRDAFRLLGFSKLSTFRELAHSLGVI